MKRILYCDFDGTLIRENSEEMLVSFLLRSNFFCMKHYMVAALGKAVNSFQRMCERGMIIKAWPVHISAAEKERVITEFWDAEIDNTHIYSPVVSLLKTFDGEKVILTGSDEELVKAFLLRKDLNAEIDAVIGSKVYKNGLVVRRHPYGRDKCLFLDPYAYKVGIANEKADRFFLESCNEAYIVSGDKELERIANGKRWKVI